MERKTEKIQGQDHGHDPYLAHGQEHQQKTNVYNIYSTIDYLIRQGENY